MNRTISCFLLLLLMCSFPMANANTPTITAPKSNQSTFVTSWLVAGPLPSPYHSNETKKQADRVGYDKDFFAELGGEGNVHIKEGTSIEFRGTKVKFKQHMFEENYLDLLPVFGDKSNICAYFYCEIKSKKNQPLFLHAGTNDAGKIWVGNKLIIEHPFDGGAERSEHFAKIELKKGTTPVLMKIDQAGGGWGAFVELYGVKAHKKFLAERKARDKGKDFNDPGSIASHIETQVICKQENRYIGWPTIGKTKSGELLAVFSGDRDLHVCPWGKVQMVRSHDNGKTWSEPETINNYLLDDRDAGILETQSGTLLVSWFTSLAFDTADFYKAYPQWKRHAEKLSPEVKKFWLGNWTRRSTDNGKTWETPVKQNVSAPHGPIELKDGRLLYVGTGKLLGEKVLAVEESVDDGRSWQMLATINIPEDTDIKNYHEPHVAEMPDGKLVALVRYEPSDRTKCFLQRSESYDGGKTWTTTHTTLMWGYPPHMIVLENGWLLNVYGVRRKRYSERACISKDGGKTWDIENEIILAHARNGDLGYPASVQLDDGSILTVYYQIDQAGEKTSLHCTHWRLK